MDPAEVIILSNLPELLTRYSLQVKTPDVYNLLAYHIYNLIINICSVISTLTLVQNPKGKRVEPKHIKFTLDYVQKECYPQIKKGGSYNIDAQYFGSDTSYNAYSESSIGTNMAIDFQTNTARPAFQITSGGAMNSVMEFQSLVLDNTKKETFLGINLRDIFTSYALAISDHSLDIVKKVLKMHLNCFMYDLKEFKKLTLKNVQNTLELERHSVFN